MSATVGEVAAPRGRLRGLSLRKNFTWSFAGNMFYALTNWGLISVLAKLGTPAVLGKFTLGLAIASPIVTAAMLHLGQVQVTDARDEYDFEHYFGTRIIMSVLALVVIAGWALAGGYQLETALVILCVGAAKCIDAVSEIVRGLFQRHQRLNLSSISLAIKGGAGLATMAIVYYLTKNIIVAAAAWATSWTLGMVFFDLPRAKSLLLERGRVEGGVHRLRPSFDVHRLSRLILRALPAGIGMSLVTLGLCMPRYVLESYRGEAELGYYGALGFVVTASAMIVGALCRAVAPRLAVYFAEDLRQFRRMMAKLVLLALGLGCGLIGFVVLFGRLVLTILYKPDYAQYQPEFIILAVSGTLVYVAYFGGVGIMAARHFKIQMFAGAVTCLVGLPASFLLIPRYGIRGAAIAALVTNAGMALFYFVGLHVVVVREERARLQLARTPVAEDTP